MTTGLQKFMTLVSDLLTDSTLLIYGAALIGITILAVMIVRKFITLEDNSHQSEIKRKQAELDEQQRIKREDLARRRKQIEDKKERVREVK